MSDQNSLSPRLYIAIAIVIILYKASGTGDHYSLSPRFYVAMAIVTILHKAGYTLGTFEESIGGRYEGPGIKILLSPRLYIAIAMAVILHKASGGVNPADVPRRPRELPVRSPEASVGGSGPWGWANEGTACPVTSTGTGRVTRPPTSGASRHRLGGAGRRGRDLGGAGEARVTGLGKLSPNTSR